MMRYGLIRSLLVWLLAVWVTLLTVVVLMVSTPWGTRIALIIANTVEGIEAQYASGSLLNGLELIHVSIDLGNPLDKNLDSMHIELKQLYLIIQPKCLIQGHICVEKLVSEYMEFAYSAGNGPEPVPQDSTLIDLPVVVIANHVAITKGKVIVNDMVIDVDRFTTALSLKQFDISFNHPEAKQVKVTMPESASEKEKHTFAESEWILANLPSIDIPLRLNISSLQVQKILLGLGNKHQQFSTIKLNASWKQKQVDLASLQVDYLDTIISANGQVELQQPYPLDMHFSAFVNAAPGWPELAGSHISAAISGSMDDMNLTLSSQGPLALSVSAKAGLSSAVLPFSFDLEATALPLATAITDQIAPSSVLLSLSGTLAHQQGQLSGTFAGYGYDSATLALDFEHHDKRLLVKQLSISDTNKGQLQARGWLGYANGLDWQADVSLSELVLPSWVPASVRLDGQLHTRGQWQGDQWLVEVKDSKISGEVDGLPASFQGDFSINSDWHVPRCQLHIAVNGSRLHLSGYSDDHFHFNGHLSSDDLSPWMKGLRGGINADITVRGAIKQPVISSNIHWNTLHYAEFVIPALQLSSQYRPLNKHQIDITVTADTLAYNKQNLRQFKLQFMGDQDEHQLTITSNGEWSVNLMGHGQWLAQSSRWQGWLEKSELHYQHFQLALESPVELMLESADRSLLVSAHCWLAESLTIFDKESSTVFDKESSTIFDKESSTVLNKEAGKLCLQKDAKIGQKGSLSLLWDINFSAFNTLVLPETMNLESNLSGNINVGWDKQALLQLDGVFRLDQGQITMTTEMEDQAAIVQWQGGDVKLNLVAKKLQINANLSGENNKVMTASVQLSDKFELIDGLVRIDQLSLQSLDRLFPGIRSINGAVDAEITFAGPVNNPEFLGHARLLGGGIDFSDTTHDVKQINIEIDFTGHQATISGAFSLDNDNASVSGTADWQQDFLLDMHIRTSRMTVLSRPMFNVTFGTDLAIKLISNKIIVTGKVDVLGGEFKLKKLPEGAVVPSKDLVVVDSAGAEITGDSGIEFETDIRLSIEPGFNVSGVGFNGQLEGELHLKQKIQRPLQLFGQLNVLEGRYQAYGQRLKIKVGEIGFDGPSDNPHINMRAIREIHGEDKTAGIQLLGLADNLQLSFFSDPSMSQPEILSYLVRGRGLDAETGYNAELATSLGVRLVKSTGVIRKLDAVPLIHSIEVDAEGTGHNTQATISGYVGERIYLKYGVGVYEPVNEMTVRFYFLSRLWLETVSGLKNSADIYYSFDIE
jgi:translocation and assembly module TamB